MLGLRPLRPAEACESEFRRARLALLWGCIADIAASDGAIHRSVPRSSEDVCTLRRSDVWERAGTPYRVPRKFVITL